MLVWVKKPVAKTVDLEYRVFPFLIAAPTRRMSFDSIFYRFKDSRSQFTVKNPHVKPLDFGNINSNGSIVRSLSLGNRQDAMFNSSLNLHLNGYMGDSILINAAISDNNMAIQPDGNTQNLDEFDQAMIRFSKDKWKLSLGDLNMHLVGLYFMHFNKRLQGFSFETESRINKKINNNFLVSAAIAKGKFTRHIFRGIEGNQGPYRLKGPNQEFVLMVLAGTERVFIDGILMQRGEEKDYTINYNTAELSFTSKQMISQDKRIQIEFEYLDRNYLNTQFYINNKSEISKKLKLALAIVGNGDAINSPIHQHLIVNSLGNILYKKIDSVYAPGKMETIYVYHPGKTNGLYSLSFIEVGEGNGNYTIDLDATAIGKVYKWVTPNPQTGVKNGKYEPVFLLVAPQKQRMASMAAAWAMNEQTQVLTDLAFNRYDTNSFSSKDKLNDGYAARLMVKNKKILHASSGLSLQTNLSADYASAGFMPIEKLRAVEFLRDWGLEPQHEIAKEKIFNAAFVLENFQEHRLKYAFESYFRNANFKADRHQIEHRLNFKGWIINNQFAFTHFKDEQKTGRFIRPSLDLSKRIRALQGREFRIRYSAEKNTSHFNQNDSITPGSFFFSTFQLSTQSDPSRLNKWGISYFKRADAHPMGKLMHAQDHSNSINISGVWMSNVHHQLRGNVTYRKLNILGKGNGKTSEESMLGRVEYIAKLWKDAIIGNMQYDWGGGQEPKRNFTFVEVPAGLGKHTWIDFNKDGIPQLTEFEEAKYPDQAKYLRVFIPTNDFIRSNNLQCNYNFTFQPSMALDDTRISTLHAFLKRIYLQSSMQISQQQFAEDRGAVSPIKGMTRDTNLIAFDHHQSHSFSINKFSQIWSMDIHFMQSSNRTFMTYGFETRHTRDFSIKLWSSWWKILTLDLVGKMKRNILEVPNVGNRNFNILSQVIEPRISFVKRTNLRLQTSFKWDIKENIATENAMIRSFMLDGKYNLVSNTSISSGVTISNVYFNGIVLSSPGHVMLDGLQPGKNFMWTVDLTKRISDFLEMSIQYEGRRSGNSAFVHVGRAQVRAIL